MTLFGYLQQNFTQNVQKKESCRAWKPDSNLKKTSNECAQKVNLGTNDYGYARNASQDVINSFFWKWCPEFKALLEKWKHLSNFGLRNRICIRFRQNFNNPFDLRCPSAKMVSVIDNAIKHTSSYDRPKKHERRWIVVIHNINTCILNASYGIFSSRLQITNAVVFSNWWTSVHEEEGDMSRKAIEITAS